MANATKAAGKFYDVCQQTLTNLVQHSYYYDSIELLIKEFVDPYELYWHREPYQEIFQATLTATTTILPPWITAIGKEKDRKSSSTTNAAAMQNEISLISMLPNTLLAFFFPLESILNTIDRDCLEEMDKVGKAAMKVGNQLLSMISEQMMDTFKQLWDFYNRLESRYHPIEAAKRIERVLDAKLKNTALSEEALPGMESEEYAEKQIYKFIWLQKYLCYLLKPFHQKKKLVIYRKEYALIPFMKSQLISFMKNRFVQIFIMETTSPITEKASGNGRSNSIRGPTAIESNSFFCHRFSSSMMKFLHGMKIMQYGFQLLDLNINNYLVQLLTMQCLDEKRFPAIGFFNRESIITSSITSNNSAKDAEEKKKKNQNEQKPLIDFFSQWFVILAHAIHHHSTSTSSSTASGLPPFPYLLWVPSKNMFMNFNKQRYHSAAHQNKHMSTSKNSNSTTSRFENLLPQHPSFAIELFLNPDDLTYLLSLIGIHGYLAIESALLDLIVEQVMYSVYIYRLIGCLMTIFLLSFDS